MIIIAIIFFITGVFLFSKHNIKRRCTEIATGTILGDETLSYKDSYDHIERYIDSVSYIYYVGGVKAVRGSINRGFFRDTL